MVFSLAARRVSSSARSVVRPVAVRRGAQNAPAMANKAQIADATLPSAVLVAMRYRAH